MTINDHSVKATNDKTPKTYSYSDLSKREAGWVIHKLNLESGLPRHMTSGNHSQKMDAINQFVARDSDAATKVAQLVHRAKSMIIPDEELKWIEGERVVRWLQIQDQRSITRLLSPYLSWGNVRDDFIEALDRLDVEEPTRTKLRLIRQHRNAWSSIVNNDKRYEWLRKDNPAQVTWAWGYMLKKTNGAIQAIYTPTDNLERYNAIRFYFDAFQNQAQAELDLSKMSKISAQNTYRENLVDHQQYNLVLLKETVATLKRMADKQQVKPAHIVEQLVREANQKSVNSD